MSINQKSMPEEKISLTRNEYRLLHTKAEDLRRQGLSYREIRAQLPIAKTTLSNWCSSIELTDEQINRLKLLSGKSVLGPYLGGRANREKSLRLKKAAYENGLSEISNVGGEMLKVAGALLYWAEGNKTHGTAITNSDPVIIIFMIEWFEKILEIGRRDIKVHLHLHQGQDEQTEKEYWANLTKVPLVNFGKSFFKPVGTGHRKNILYHGTIRLSVLGHGPEFLRHRIMGWAHAVAKSYVPREIIELRYHSRMGR
jgi:hypothetical protein